MDDDEQLIYIDHAVLGQFKEEHAPETQRMDDDEQLINIDHAVLGQFKEEHAPETQRMDDDEQFINIDHAVLGQFKEEHAPETQRSNETWGETDDEPLITIVRTDSTAQGTSDDEHIPLSNLARHPADDLSVRPEGCPGTSAPSSEEGGEQDKVQIQPSERKTIKLRNQRPVLSNNEQLDRVLTACAQAAMKQELSRAERESNLNNILSANGYYKTNVPSDGNCFFESASLHLDGMDPLALRSSLCDHLDRNFASYIEFMSCEGDVNERHLSYVLNAENLRRPGTWSNDAADLLPMALADWSGRHIKIFTSDPSKPVLSVQPKTGDRALAPITLCLLEAEAPHYEAVFEIARHSISHHFTAATSPRSNQPTSETPSNQGNFETPPKNQLFRERTDMPTRWKRSSRKRLRLEGKEYTSESGQVKRAKILQQVDCTKCRFKCHALTADNRRDIFQAFYGLASYERQKDFICSNVLEKPTQTLHEEGKAVPKKRQTCRTFAFNVAGKKQRICKKMFLATLDIGEAYVEHALRNGEHGSFTGREERGRHKPHNKTPEDAVERAKKHIESFPVVESYYTLKDSQRKYLAANLSITKMYELYKEETQREGVGCVSKRRYRSLFNQNSNQSFQPTTATSPQSDQLTLATSPTADHLSTATSPWDDKPTTATSPWDDKPTTATSPWDDKPTTATSPWDDKPTTATSPWDDKPTPATSHWDDKPTTATSPWVDQPTTATSPQSDQLTAATSPWVDHPFTATSPWVDQPSTATSPWVDQPTTATSPQSDQLTLATSPQSDQPSTATSPWVDQPTTATSPTADHPSTATSPWDDKPTTETSPWDDKPTTATSPWDDKPTTATSPWDDKPTTATSHWDDQPTTATSPWDDKPTTATSPWDDKPTTATSPQANEQTTTTSPHADQPTTATSPHDSRPEQQFRLETPSKQGNFKTPPKKQLFRERTDMTTRRKKSSRKILRLEGKEYTSESGGVKRAKMLQQVDCTKCRFKCHALTADNRQDIFQAFYGLASYERQKDFICSNVLEKPTQTLHEEGKAVPKKRQTCRTFAFNVAGKKQRICKKMFLATLDIGEAYVEHALRNGEHGSFTGREERGRHKPHNKTPEDAVERAKKHIESFPAVESYYTQKDSQRKYLAANLSITKMYQLYTEETQREGVGCVSKRRYRSLFNQNYNLSFQVPKTDQCAKCTLYATKQKCGTLTEEERDLYKGHLQKKEEAIKEKESDKDNAKKDPSLHVITVGMQGVLQAPSGVVSQLYYKRKLSVFTFTIHSLADGRATCYTWDETEAKRGACEIATCLFMYVSSLPEHVHDVIIYSDYCEGQNRNQCLASCFMHAVNTIPHVNTITLKYLETGHTHMECDAMHSAIASAKKHTPIYTPSGWDIVLRQARRTKPYLVLPLKFTDVVNFKEVARSRVRNMKTDTKGQKVRWLHIKSLQFRKGIEDLMFFKYTLADEDHLALRLIGSAKRGRPDPTKPLPRLYSSKLPICEAKKRDLLSLFESEVIPPEHYPFYQPLTVSAAAKDKLAEPDVNESDQDTDGPNSEAETSA